MELSFLLVGLPLLAIVVMFRAMLPMQPVRLQLGALLAADTTTLAAGTANMVALIIAPFSLTETIDIATLTFASTNGLSPIATATGAQEVAVDAVSFAQIITLKPGAVSGFRWVTSGSFSGPLTIYGYALTDNAQAVLLAAQNLATPITVDSAGLQIDLDPLQLVFVLQPLN